MAHIHGLEETDGVTTPVLELVDGNRRPMLRLFQSRDPRRGRTPRPGRAAHRRRGGGGCPADLRALCQGRRHRHDCQTAQRRPRAGAACTTGSAGRRARPGTIERVDVRQIEAEARRGPSEWRVLLLVGRVPKSRRMLKKLLAEPCARGRSTITVRAMGTHRAGPAWVNCWPDWSLQIWWRPQCRPVGTGSSRGCSELMGFGTRREPPAGRCQVWIG